MEDPFADYQQPLLTPQGQAGPLSPQAQTAQPVEHGPPPVFAAQPEPAAVVQYPESPLRPKSNLDDQFSPNSYKFNRPVQASSLLSRGMPVPPPVPVTQGGATPPGGAPVDQTTDIEEQRRPGKRMTVTEQLRGKVNELTAGIQTKDSKHREIVGVVGQSLEFLNISIEAKKGDKVLLDRISGQVYGGETVAILGPSGCGKTTLLNVLAGRTNSMPALKPYTGKISLSGAAFPSVLRKKAIAYVVQEDEFFPELTVKEVLMFAARLKIPKEDQHDVEKRVADVIEDMGLTHATDTRVGGEKVKGISGGEKRRLAIGVELVNTPQILFLDEPTSGLDTVSATKVCKILQNLAVNHNCLIMSTIHQPSIEIFSLFTRTILLNKGQIVYCGATDQLGEHFSSAPFWTPEDGKSAMYDPASDNLADFVLETLSGLPKDRFSEAVEGYRNEHATQFYELQQLIDQNHEKKRTKELEAIYLRLGESIPDQNSIKLQVKEISTRILQRTFRAPKLFIIMKFMLPVFILFLQGFMAKGLGNSDLPQDIYSRWSLLASIMLLITMDCTATVILAIPLESPIRRRELSSNTYSPTSYILSKILIEWPFSAVMYSIGFLLAYALIPFNGPLQYEVPIIVLHTWASMSVAWLTAVLAPDQEAALSVIRLLINPQIMFIGMLVKVDNMQKFMQWIPDVCFIKLSVNLLAIVEFRKNDHPQEKFLKDQHAYRDKWYIYLMVMASLLVIGVLGSIGIMWKRNRSKDDNGGDGKIEKPADYDPKPLVPAFDLAAVASQLNFPVNPEALRAFDQAQGFAPPVNNAPAETAQYQHAGAMAPRKTAGGDEEPVGRSRRGTNYSSRFPLRANAAERQSRRRKMQRKVAKRRYNYSDSSSETDYEADRHYTSRKKRSRKGTDKNRENTSGGSRRSSRKKGSRRRLKDSRRRETGPTAPAKTRSAPFSDNRYTDDRPADDM